MNTSILFKSALLISVVLILSSCNKTAMNNANSNLETENTIPKPLAITATHFNFILNANSNIKTSNDDEFKRIGAFLSEKIEEKTGLELAVNNLEKKHSIVINKTTNYPFSDTESYQLQILKDSVIINAATNEGAFWAVQTLRQLIPYTNSEMNQKEYAIPTGEILDTPNYAFRGAMLDVARHFFTVDDVKKYIDVLAYYKMNILHLHLSDDQGWRIEIKSWPNLTSIGGHTQVGGESGGFYTQEDYTEIVNYAAKHFITIIPEIDMPGHTHAASVSYPFLNGAKEYFTILDSKNLDRKNLLYTGIDVGFSTFDTRKEKVYNFIDDVIREITALTPGPYFHMGGDESLVTSDEDYKYFVSKTAKIVRKYGKTMIGWDEVATVDEDPNSVVQFWAKENNAKIAKNKGMKIIMSPAKKSYLDMKYDSLSKLGLHWAAYIPVDSSYLWVPEKYIDGISKNDILGIEAPLWSETISNMQELEYLAFPRLIGIAEVAWSTEENRNWEDYKERLANQTPYLNQMNINYYPSKLIDWKE